VCCHSSACSEVLRVQTIGIEETHKLRQLSRGRIPMINIASKREFILNCYLYCSDLKLLSLVLFLRIYSKCSTNIISQRLPGISLIK
jgi:hypothetical protein